jgi:RNA polymerase sigma-70 factor (ECF subfamily)
MVTVNAVLMRRWRRAIARDRLLEDAAPSGGDVAGGAWRPGQEAGPDETAEGQELHARLEAAIAGLPNAYRDPFALSDVERLPNAEIARVLELTVPAVKSRLHRARLLLRDAPREYVRPGREV